MKAFQLFKYNSTDIRLQKVEIDRPRIRPNEVLIEVKAAGVNPLDNLITRGEVKLVTPYRFPLTMGNECSGIVAETGPEVHDLSVGDRVFTRLPTDQIGAFAEYVAVPAAAVAHMPQRLDFIEAASIPLTALTAYQALELMAPKASEHIFISGGSGGLGAMAIPLAKARGLVVYTNGNKASRERVLALGADRYLDYRQEDYLKELSPVDYVLDSVGGKELSKQIQLLKAGGMIVSLRGLPNGRFAKRFGLPWWKQSLFSLVAHRLDREARARNATYEFLFVEANGRQLTEVAHLIEKQGIRPSIDKVFAFEQANEALAKVAQGGSAGKVILSLAN
jgi:NADPH:quinone reductase and related Zn-dependent oxidoreductase